jgi:Ca-activated chloride channel family protein
MRQSFAIRHRTAIPRRPPFAAIAAGVLATVLLATAGCGASDGGSSNQPGPIAPPGLGDRDYPTRGVGPEVDANQEPRSTFAIDIDTASYAFARRQILDGRRPERESVRPEEFINAFRQDYPQPGGNGFNVVADGARLPRTHETRESAESVRLLRVGLQTRGEVAGQRPDAALTFVVDVSGSMAEPGRLDLVQAALHTLVDQLRDTDAVAIVAYESAAKVLRPMTEVRSRSVLHRAIDDLRTGGSTNLEEGLVTGYRVAREGFRPGATNRVILLSDGLANVGNTTAEPILEQIREEAAKKISLLGVGVGSEYGDALMERLADEGDGFVTYVSELAQARQLFVSRLPATLTVRALDAKVQVTFDPATVATYRLIGYENRAVDPSAFRDDRVDGGEVGPGHSVTALYLVRLRDTDRGDGVVAEARVRWLDPVGREALEASAIVTVTDLARDFPNTSPRLRVSYAAAYVAEVLRGSPYAEEVRLGDLASIAEDAFRETDDAQVAELTDLIRRSARA